MKKSFNFLSALAGLTMLLPMGASAKWEDGFLNLMIGQNPKFFAETLRKDYGPIGNRAAIKVMVIVSRAGADDIEHYIRKTYRQHENMKRMGDKYFGDHKRAPWYTTEPDISAAKTGRIAGTFTPGNQPALPKPSTTSQYHSMEIDTRRYARYQQLFVPEMAKLVFKNEEKKTRREHVENFLTLPYLVFLLRDLLLTADGKLKKEGRQWNRFMAALLKEKNFPLSKDQLKSLKINTKETADKQLRNVIASFYPLNDYYVFSDDKSQLRKSLSEALFSGIGIIAESFNGKQRQMFEGVIAEALPSKHYFDYTKRTQQLVDALAKPSSCRGVLNPPQK